MVQRSVAPHDDNQPSDDFSSDLMPPAPQGRPGDPPPDRGSDVIIRSKVRAPVLRDTTLTRPRLLKWLDQHADDRVRVLAAEAGFGKTTLLTDWAHRTTLTVRWLKLDPMDAEWASFISYLVAAFQEGLPSFGDATQRMLGHVASLGITRDQVTGQFIAELGAAVTVPTVLILDDLQHVQGDADVQAILERVIERAPHALTFILSGRSRPEVRLGRLTAQGNVVALGTDDLRFTPDETRDLFAQKYRMPLDHDLVAVVDARTEGWGASLQLLYSSVRGQRSAQVRDFIESLEGHRQPLYDFLAEEVLGRQEPEMQTVLLHAAVLDRIVPRWVDAALSVLPAPPDSTRVMEMLDDADDLGLMSRNAEGSSSRRFHPLMHEFMASHLAATVPVPTLRLMHLRVAEAAESMHWPTSAHHYIEAGEGEQAMRVISDATITALGTGAWGNAIKLLERIPEVPPSVAVQAIKARGLVASGDATGALELLAGYLESPDLTGRDRALVRLATAAALGNLEDEEEAIPVLEALAADPETPALIGAVARAWLQIHQHDTYRVGPVMHQLALLASRENLYLYAAIAHHNAASAWLWGGSPKSAMDEAQLALHNFGLAQFDEGNAASARAVVAHSAYEMGDFSRCHAELEQLHWLGSPQADAYAEAALLHAWLGNLAAARASVARARGLLAVRDVPGTMRDIVRTADAVIDLVEGRPDKTLTAMSGMREWSSDANNDGARCLVRLMAAALTQPATAVDALATQSLVGLAERSIYRWEPFVRLVRGIVSGDRAEIDAATIDESTYGDGVLLALADVICWHLGQFQTVPERISSLVRRWPERWRRALRNALNAPVASSSAMAAALLAEYGDDTDHEHLLEWERRGGKSAKAQKNAVRLARRVSPTLRIHDLGRCRLGIGSRDLAVTGVRRRAASLLLYLVSRPRQVATREQVFDALWPDQDLEQAGNSLHQTLFFLRRELGTKSTPGKPMVEYVPVEGELIYLDRELVHIDSAAFERQAREASTKDPGSAEVLQLLQSYDGQFAPEFQYEDWAIPWRDQTHGVFLELSERAARTRIKDRPTEAAAILRHALGVDPAAYPLKPLMAGALHRSGSEAAAQRLYRQYRRDYEEEFGEEPGPFSDILAQLGRG